jgi:hypothetical protein
MVTVMKTSAYREYILQDGFRTLNRVSLNNQIKALRVVLEQMRISSQTAALVLDRELHHMVDYNSQS